MWKWNVNSVVLLYKYLELASDKSTKIKTQFLGLETHNITVIVYILQPGEATRKILEFYADEILLMVPKCKQCWGVTRYCNALLFGVPSNALLFSRSNVASN